MITASDLKLTGHRVFESTDVEDTKARISAIMQPHELTPVGRAQNLHAYMSFVDLFGFGVGSIKFGHMRVRLEHVEDYHLMIFCPAGSGRVYSGRDEVALDRQTGIYLPPHAPLDAEFSEDCEQFVLRIRPELFRKHTGQRNPSVPLQVDLAHPTMQAWAHVLSGICDNPELARQNSRIAMDYQRLLLGMLVQSGCRDQAQKQQTAPFSVKRAEAFILENAASPICLEDIAKAADVPARTLLSSFRRFRDTSPIAYLREVRLDRVRKRLSMADEAHSVTAIALEEGFSHLGRFAQDYAVRFGERPSETLRAARSRRS